MSMYNIISMCNYTAYREGSLDQTYAVLKRAAKIFSVKNQCLFNYNRSTPGWCTTNIVTVDILAGIKNWQCGPMTPNKIPPFVNRILS